MNTSCNAFRQRGVTELMELDTLAYRGCLTFILIRIDQLHVPQQAVVSMRFTFLKNTGLY